MAAHFLFVYDVPVTASRFHGVGVGQPAETGLHMSNN